MSSHECETYQCILRSTSWRNNRVDEHTCIVSHLGNNECLLLILNDVESLESCCCGSWSVRGAEDVSTAVVTEEVDRILV
ncbi:Uncharacterised protein [Segatella copri]|nr:Uncharacterised protein [Segatella copri]